MEKAINTKRANNIIISTMFPVITETCGEPPHVSVITGNILITIITFGRCHLLLSFNSIFMTDSQYLGIFQIWQTLNEHWYYLTSTKSMICQIDGNCFPFQSLNMLPFHIRLECLKLIYRDLISNFSKYCFKTATICLLFSSSHAFTALEFDSNHFHILFGKIVKPPDHNEIKPPVGKIFRKYKPIRHYFVMRRK